MDTITMKFLLSTHFQFLVVIVCAQNLLANKMTTMYHEQYQSTNHSKDNRPIDAQVTFLGTHNIFKVSDFYHFYTPHVSLSCECHHGLSSSLCSRENYKANKICAHYNNINQSCSYFYATLRNVSTCAKAATVCCQMYFSVPEDEEYTASKLKRNFSIFKWTIKYSKADKPIYEVLNVPENVTSFFIDANHVIQLPNAGLVNEAYDWVYSPKGSEKLIPMKNNNEIDELSFGKVGWFRKGYNDKLRYIPPMELVKYLKIEPRNCGDQNQSIEWYLNAVNYYHNDKQQLVNKVNKKSTDKPILWNRSYNQIMDTLSADEIVEKKYPIEVEAIPKDINFKTNMSYTTELRLEVDINVSDSQSYCLKVYTDIWNTEKCFQTPNKTKQLNCQLPSDTLGQVWICLGNEKQWKQSHLCKVIKVVEMTWDIEIRKANKSVATAMFSNADQNLFVKEPAIEFRETFSISKFAVFVITVTAMSFGVFVFLVFLMIRHKYRFFNCAKANIQTVRNFGFVYQSTTKPNLRLTNV